MTLKISKYCETRPAISDVAYYCSVCVCSTNAAGDVYECIKYSAGLTRGIIIGVLRDSCACALIVACVTRRNIADAYISDYIGWKAWRADNYCLITSFIR